MWAERQSVEINIRAHIQLYKQFIKEASWPNLNVLSVRGNPVHLEETGK